MRNYSMTKLNFQKLARGVKLLKEHLYTPINETLENLTDLTTSGITISQMEEPNGSFTIHLSIPNFTAFHSSTTIPFVLPPYQQDPSWADGVSTLTTPSYTVTDIGFSFDSRDEVAAIKAAGALADPNKLDYNLGGSYKLEVNLLETKQNSYGNTDQGFSRYSTVWSNTIPANAWETALNPHTYSEIGVELKPFRTYIMKITAPDIITDELSMPNLNIWLKCNTPLKTRDIHRPASGMYVQNLPTIHNGEYQSQPVTAVNPPVVGSLVSANYTSPADPYDGVQTSLEKVDSIFKNKLRSGYNINSETPSSENIYTDSGYTVIAVPMWGNQPDVVTRANVGNTTLPYLGAFPYTIPTVDRRIIPLQRGFTIHNVIACCSYGTGIKPKSPTLLHEIGVAIGSGWRSDLHTYQQIASLAYNPLAGAGSYEIDNTVIPIGSTGAAQEEWDVFSLPIVAVPGQFNQDQYGTQGTPFYVGQARTGTDARTDVGTGVANPPNTAGLENFLEVRWSISDSAGLANLNVGEVIVPRYGNWVYIFGKQTIGE